MQQNQVSQAKDPACRAMRTALSVALAASLCPAPATALADEASGSSASDSEAVAGQDEVDITAQWAAGGMGISAGGTYVLSDDVRTDGALSIAAPAGQTVTLDLRGHSVEVRGAVPAAIAVDGSAGQVRIIDSTFDEAVARGERAADDAPTSQVRLAAFDASAAVAAVRWNASEDAKGAQPKVSLSHVAVQAALLGAHDEGDGAQAPSPAKLDCYGVYAGYGYETDADSLDLALEGCSVSATVADEQVADGQRDAWAEADGACVPAERRGAAVSVFTKVKGVSLDGKTDLSATSDGGAAQLYAERGDAFSLGERFSFEGSLKAYAAGGAQGTVLASCASDDEAAKLAGSIVDASGAHVFAASGADIVCAGKAAAASAGASTASAERSGSSEGAASVAGDADGQVKAAAAARPAPASAHPADALLSPVVEGSPLELPAWVRPLAEQSVDLNAKWKDSATSLSITESGTYFLSDDLHLSDAATLFVSGSADVVLDLNGHTLYFDCTSNGGHDISVSGTASLTIEGADGGSIVDTGLNIFDVVYMNSTGQLAVRDASISLAPSEEHSNPKALNMRCVALQKGSATIEGSRLSVDQTKVATAKVETQAVHPCGVYVAGDATATSLSVRGTSIAVTASPATMMGYATDLDDDAYAGPGFDAYGIYAASSKTATTVAGCSVDVASPQGQAIGLVARNASVASADGGQDGLSVKAASSYVAAAVKSLAEGGVSLDSDASLSVAEGMSPRRAATLFAPCDKAFALQEGFTGKGASLLERADGQENVAGMVPSAFGYAPSAAKLQELSAGLSNALGADAPCGVQVTAQGASFALAEGKAPAEVVHANGSTTAYSSVEQAFSAALDGECVRLAQDVDHIALAGGKAGATVTVDLAGHAARSVDDAAAADVVLTSTEGRGSIDGTALVAGSGSARTEAAVAYEGTGSLTLRNIDVNASAERCEVAGVLVSAKAAGTLSLDDVAVSATSSIATASAVSIASATKAKSVDIAGGSLSVVQMAASLSGYGVRCQSANVPVDLRDCPVSVRTQAGSAIGVQTAGTLHASSEKPAGQVFSVSTESASAQTVAGVQASGAKAIVRLDDCSVSTRCDEPCADAPYWALSASAKGAQISLDGACLLESDSGKAVTERGCALSLAEGFENAGEGLISVYSTDLTSDVFARTQAAGEAAAEQACLFEPVSGSAYDGWVASAADDGGIAWSSEPVVRNESTGASYASAAKAFSEASAGDVLQLVADGASHAALTVSKNLTLDLAGHSLSVRADKAGASSAVTVSADELSIVDSADEKGELDLRVGAASERAGHSAASGTPYAGVTVGAARASSHASLRIDGACVRTAYVGAGPTEQIKSQDVAGVFTQTGSVSLTGGSRLSVSGAQAAGAACAGAAYGVYVGSAVKDAAEPSVEVSSDSSVEAANDGGLITLGNVRDGSYDSEFEEGFQALVRIKPDEDSALYQEILQKFRARAKLDDGNDATGEDAFGMRCYYAERVSLDDGTIFWAASKPVPAGQETLDNIVPEVIFVQSLYQAPPKAYGIAAAEAAAASVTVGGRVDAASCYGDAYGVAAAGAGSWTVDGAQVSARGGEQTYRGVADAQINLNDYLQVDNPPVGKNWFYPGYADPHLVCEKSPVASAVTASGKAGLTLAGACGLDAQALDAADVSAESFSVAPTFAPRSGEAVTVADPNGENAAGKTFAVPVEGAVLSAGWFADAAGKLSVVAADDGSLRWSAPCSIVFHGESGVVARYGDVLAGSSVALPDPSQMAKRPASSVQYEFLGWARTAGASEPEVAADAASVVVDGDADYYPVYRTVARTVSVTFKNLRAADGSALPNAEAAVGYASTFSASASVPVPAQGSYAGATGTWRFVGWRDSLGRVWDGEGLVSDVTFDYATFSGAAAGAVSLSAAYVLVAPGQHLVTFKVDGRAYAYAADDGDAPSFYRASSSTAVAPAKVATTAGYLYTFEGWHDGWLAGTGVDKSSVDFGASASLPAVAGDAVYTACFTAVQRQAYVRFKYWKPTGDGYAYLPSSPASVPYGSDPISEADKLVKLGDVIVVDGLSYRFLGWSVRETDKDALYTDSLPACTNTDSTGDRLMYYGIYKLDEQKVSVTFHDGDAVYATADDQAATSTVDEALAAAGAVKPSTRPDGQVFKGWATKPDATAPDVNGATLLKTAAGTAETLDLYAVYGAAYEPTLTFVSADGQVLGSAKIASGTPLSAVKGIPSAPAVAGRFFRGWALGTGSLVDVNAGISADTRLVAAYGDITTNAVEGDEDTNVTGFADVSQATLADAAAQGASQVVLNLANSSSVGQTLSAQAKVNGDAIVGDAVYSVKYLIDGNGLAVAGNVGRVTLTLKCGAVGGNAKVRAYWTRADGSVGYTDAMTSDASGLVSFTLSNYSALSGEGNVAIAEVGAAAGQLDGSAVGGLGGASLSGASGASLAGNTLSGTLTAASAAGAALAGAAADGAALDGAGGAALADLGADAASDDPADGADLLADDMDTSVAISDIAGNPVMWVLAILTLGLAAALAWYFLVARKRLAVAGADDDDDEAGWSDEREAAAADGDAAPAAPAAPAPAPADGASKTGGISF